MAHALPRLASGATRRRLPLWFAVSSAAGLGALLELAVPVPVPQARVVGAYAAVAQAAELASARGVERAAERAGVAKPLHAGRAARLWRASRWLGAASLLATLCPWGGRTRAAIAARRRLTPAICAHPTR